MDWQIGVTTHDRPELFCRSTLDYLERCVVEPERVSIFITAENVPLYDLVPEQWRRRFVPCRSGLTNKRSWAETRYYQRGARVLWINDDVFFAEKLEAGKLVERPIQQLAREGFDLLVGSRAKLWGLYAVRNAFFMKQQVRHDLRHIVGCCYGVVITHDESRLPRFGDAKEDYERSCRFFRLDGTVMRMDYWTIKTIYFNSPDIVGDVPAIERNVAMLKQEFPGWVRDDTVKKKRPWPEIRIGA